jgi:8-oxo-dGTP pyrophosphatase MutT (NUDIX family)
MPASAGAVAVDDRGRALLIWRHRFITGLWGWEMPMGRIDPREAPAQAAAREVEEETGWRPGPLRQLARVQPSSGIMDAAHYLFIADGATRTGAAADGFESMRIAWVPPDRCTEAARQAGNRQLLIHHRAAALPPGRRPPQWTRRTR